VKSLFAVFWISLTLSQFLVPLTRWLFLKLGKLDHPDGRKMHTVAVPRSGGLAVISAYLIAVAIFTQLPAGGTYVFDRYGDFLLRLLPAIGMVFVTGFFDDWLDLLPKYKLTGQFLASGFAYLAGVRLFDAPPGFEWLAFAATAFWLILCSNAFNLTDGTDGLAGTLGVVSCLGLITVSLTLDFYSLALVFTPLLGAILPFLRANWPPAKLFLGDTGSLTLGFLIGCGGAALARRFPAGEGLTAAILILTLPLMEVFLSSSRRLLRGKSIFAPDSFHIHHQLKRQGLPSSGVLWRLGALSLAGTTIAIVQIWLSPWLRICLILPFLIYLAYQVSSLRYPEFKVLGEGVLGGRIRSWFRHQILLQTMEEELTNTIDTSAVLSLIEGYAREFSLTGLHINLHGQKLEQPKPQSTDGPSYAVRIDLPYECWVNFRVPTSLRRTENPAADFASVLIRVFNSQRLAQLRPVSKEQALQPEATLV
jgi:UDP-GlcNAc:undecaprenyl-phosphate GlcNAc-1-phosphate transferase